MTKNGILVWHILSWITITWADFVNYKGAVLDTLSENFCQDPLQDPIEDL